MNEKKIISVQILPAEKCYTLLPDRKDCYFAKFIRFTTYNDGSTSYYPIMENALVIGFGYDNFGNHCIGELRGESKDETFTYDLDFDFITKSNFDELVSNSVLSIGFGSKEKAFDFWFKEFQSRGIIIKENI